MARILITGASGFIGGYLVARALENGHEVTAAVRPNSDLTRLKDTRIQFLQLPLEDVDSMTDVLLKAGRFDWIIHNAGVTKAISREAYTKGNTDNTRRLVTALQNAGLVPDKFLFVSSLAAKGAAAPDHGQIDEKQTPNPLTPYGRSKLDTEVMLASQRLDFPWIVIQPTAVYGPWERDILTFIQLMNKGFELTIGRQSQRLSFVHAADVAKAILLILEKGRSVHRKYILSDGKKYSTEDLGAAVREALGRKSSLRIRLPLALVKQVAGVVETISRWQNKPAALNRDKIAELSAENWHCDASALFSDVNFEAEFDLYSGMRNSVEWYRTQRWI